jgi:DNA-binding transcriptional ArsR family regulator
MAAFAAEIERVFHALGDPTRRQIVERLALGPCSVSALAAPLGITVTAVAQHVHVLAETRLVATEKNGRVRTCRLDRAGLLALERWLAERRSDWDRRFDKLGEVLDRQP